MRSHAAVLFYSVVGFANIGLAAPIPANNKEWVIGWDAPANPGDDCQFQHAGDRLTIKVPAKIHQARISSDPLDAPRLLRSVDGDFAIQVRIGGVTSPHGFQGSHRAGVIITDGKASVKIERVATAGLARVDQPSPPFSVEIGTLGEGSFECYATGVNTEVPTWVQVDRRGECLTVAISEDGIKWEWVRSPRNCIRFGDLSKAVRVGVIAETTVPCAFEPWFDRWKLSFYREPDGR